MLLTGRLLLLLLLVSVISVVEGVGRRRYRHHRTRLSSSKSSSEVTFPSKPTPIRKSLLKLIEVYRHKMYPAGQQESTPLIPLLTNQINEQPFRMSVGERKINWHPVECGALGLELREVGIISGNSRNSVYVVKDRRDGVKYAWKTFANPDEYTAEIAFFMAANHPLIVKPVCIMSQIEEEDRAGFVMELIDGGWNSRHYLQRHPHELQRIAAQVYDVLKYVHYLGFIVADLKPENIMVTREGNVKVLDFGFAITIPHYKYYRGTPSTNAPELMKLDPQAPILENIDWWAFGATLGQWLGLSVMEPINIGKNKQHRWVAVRISKSDGYYFGPIPNDYPDTLKQLLYYCMASNATMRQWNTKSQLIWFESLSFWDGINFDTIGYDWSQVTQ